MKQHFVPKCYLAGFASKKGYVFKLSTKAIGNDFRGKPREQHISSVCYADNIYSINKHSPNNTFPIHELDELFVEQKVLGKKETQFSDIRDRLIAGNFVTSDDLIFIADFIVQLKLRNPYWKASVIDKQKNIWINTILEEIGREAHTKKEFQNIPKGLRQLMINKYKSENIEDPEWSKKMQQFSLIERDSLVNPGSREIRQKLLEATWAIYEVPLNSHAYFTTTDNPGFAINNAGNIYNFHVINDFAFFFPLTYRYCLAITSRLPQEIPSIQHPLKICHVQMNELFIDSINRGGCIHINDLIIGIRDKELEIIGRRTKK